MQIIIEGRKIRIIRTKVENREAPSREGAFGFNWAYVSVSNWMLKHSYGGTWTKGYDLIEIYDRRQAFRDISQVVFVLSRRGCFYGPFGTVEQAQEYGLHKAINDKNPDYRSEHGLIVMMTVMDFLIHTIRGC